MKRFPFIVLLFFSELNLLSSNPEISKIKNIPRDAGQLIVVMAKKGIQANTYAYEWSLDQKKWVRISGPIPSTVGYRGFAAQYKKKEGDGKTPTGIFAIGTAFGYPKKVETKLSYRIINDDDYWVDDPESPLYNQWVKNKPNARSFEKMLRTDVLYSAGFVVEYNTQPVVKGGGSAIFFHVWRNSKKPTSGCIAMSRENILKVLEWLDRDKNPFVILNPAGI